MISYEIKMAGGVLLTVYILLLLVFSIKHHDSVLYSCVNSGYYCSSHIIKHEIYRTDCWEKNCKFSNIDYIWPTKLIGCWMTLSTNGVSDEDKATKND